MPGLTWGLFPNPARLFGHGKPCGTTSHRLREQSLPRHRLAASRPRHVLPGADRMAPVGRVAAGWPASRNHVAGEHGAEAAEEVGCHAPLPAVARGLNCGLRGSHPRERVARRQIFLFTPRVAPLHAFIPGHIKGRVVCSLAVGSRRVDVISVGWLPPRPTASSSTSPLISTSLVNSTNACPPSTQPSIPSGISWKAGTDGTDFPGDPRPMRTALYFKQ